MRWQLAGSPEHFESTLFQIRELYEDLHRMAKDFRTLRKICGFQWLQHDCPISKYDLRPTHMCSCIHLSHNRVAPVTQKVLSAGQKSILTVTATTLSPSSSLNIHVTATLLNIRKKEVCHLCEMATVFSWARLMWCLSQDQYLLSYEPGDKVQRGKQGRVNLLFVIVISQV